MTAIKLKIRSCFLERTAPTDKVTEAAADNCHKYARLSRQDLSSVTPRVTLLLFVCKRANLTQGYNFVPINDDIFYLWTSG